MSASIKYIRFSSRSVSQISRLSSVSRTFQFSNYSTSTIVRSVKSLRLPVVTYSSSLPSPSPFFLSQVRNYSTPNDRPSTPADIFGSDGDPNSPLEKIKNCPEILEILVDIGEYLQEKNYVTPGQPVGMLTVVKMLADSEFKQKLVIRMLSTIVTMLFFFSRIYTIMRLSIIIIIFFFFNSFY